MTKNLKSSFTRRVSAPIKRVFDAAQPLAKAIAGNIGINGAPVRYRITLGL
jgi:hypothetical protein